MSNKSQTKVIIEKQFNDLVEKAKQLYPDINENIASYSNITAYTERLQDYLNLSLQTPFEVSTNQIVLQ